LSFNLYNFFKKKAIKYSLSFSSYYTNCLSNTKLDIFVSISKGLFRFVIANNVDDKRAVRTSERSTFSHYTLLSNLFINCSIKKIISTSNKSKLQLAFQTFEKDPQLSINKVARLYNIPHTTLSTRIKGRSIHTNVIANSRKLTVLEEEMVVRKVFDLDSRRFPFRIRNIEDIANRLLAIYNATYIELR